MSRLQVVVATMNQKDFSLYHKMNIQSDMIICNQCDEDKFEETTIDGHKIRMISTTTRGASVNRNLGILFADAEIVLLADDDIVYCDGYQEKICDAFDKYREAEVIIFNFTSTGVSQMSNYNKKIATSKRSFGAPRIAYRNERLKSKGICFSYVFGPKGIYSSGEDSLFVKQLNKAGLFVLRHTSVIGNIHYGESTWYQGRTEKYYFDKGAWVRAAYPKTWRLLKYYLIVKEKNKTNFTFNKLVKLFNAGAKSYEKLLSYDESNKLRGH